MRLVAFEATGLNHIPNVKIEFNPELTFITGVNGSGKTAILNSITSLLSPNLEKLAAINFKKIKVILDLGRRKVEVWAEKTKDGAISLRVGQVKDVFRYQAYEDDVYSADDPEARRRYYQVLLTGGAQHKVLEAISELPTPMFLGLDRRHSSIHSRRRMIHRPAMRGKRNIFSSPLGASLSQAVALAEDQFAEVRSVTARYSIEFNRDLLLSLLDVPEHDPFGFEPPTEKDRYLIDAARVALRKLPRMEGISADDIRSRLSPALSNIGEIVNRIPKSFDFDKVETGDETSKSALSDVLQWTRLKPALSQITKVSELINHYNAKIVANSRRIDTYTGLIDDFFNQTGKSLGFNSSGHVEVRTENATFGVEELSSGEAQIFVILTHLMFNPDCKAAGVFIIDEPELSLHLFWQEMLTDSMMKANDSIQYIMATHSPAVIGPKVKCAIDLLEAINA